MRRNGKQRRSRVSYFTHRSLSAVLLALVLAAQAAGCGTTQDAANDSQSEASQNTAGLTESEESSEEAESADAAAENSEDANVSGDSTEDAAGDDSTEGSSAESESDAVSEGDTASDEDGSLQSADSESSDAEALTENTDSESGDVAEDSESNGGDAEVLSCRLLYEAVAAEAADGIAMVTEKEECTFLTSSYRELLEDFCYATDPEQVYCVCIVKADSEDSAQSIKAEFDDALLSMQNDMYLTTDEQKVAKAGVTGISGQYVWYISLSDDASVMSAAESALEEKLGL